MDDKQLNTELENSAEAQESEAQAQESGVQGNDELSREDILAASRKENKDGDEREQQTYNRALSLGYGVGMILLGIVMIVSVIVEDKIPAELWMCCSVVWATSGLYYGIRTSKHKWLFLASGIISIIACVFFTVYWILQLCGVAV